MWERTRALGLPEEFVTLLDELPFDICIRGPDAVCVHANAVARRRWGALIDLTPAQSSAPDRVRALWSEAVASALRGDLVVREVVYPHGTFLNLVAPLRRAGEVVGVLSADRDMTELAASRSTLAVRDRLVSMVSDQLPVIVGVRRLVQTASAGGEMVPDLLHVFDNALTARLLGVSVSDLEGKTDRQLQAPTEVLERAIRRFERARDSGKPVPFQMV